MATTTGTKTTGTGATTTGTKTTGTATVIPEATQVTDPNAGKTVKEVATGAAAGVTQAGTTGYTAEKIGTNVTGYTATDATATGYATDVIRGNDIAKYQTTDQGPAETYKATTTADELQGLIAKNSPLMQQAETAALQQMNRRGLLNSSMAVGAAQGAVLEKAIPIAQTDAQLKSEASKFGANSTNVINAANTAATNEAAKFNASSANVREAAYVSAYNAALQFGASAENAASLANAAADSAASEFEATATNVAAKADVDAVNRAREFEATGKNTAAREYAAGLNEATQTSLDNSLKVAIANADAATKIELQNIDADTRVNLANIEATYKNAMQASASANELFQQATTNIANIMSNPDLNTYPTSDGNAPSADKKNWPPGATKLTNGKLYDSKNIEILGPKQLAVNEQRNNLEGAMKILSATSGIEGLNELIDFS
jgi:hypothetical protein